MTGVTLTVDTQLAVEALSHLTQDQMGLLLDAIGGLITSQTQRRLDEEKTSPEGQPWAPWSQRYAASLSKANRQTARSLLVGAPNLLPSIQQVRTGDEVRVGSNMVYAAIHQFGGRGIPARPYLGLSGENRGEIEALVIDSLEALLP